MGVERRARSLGGGGWTGAARPRAPASLKHRRGDTAPKVSASPGHRQLLVGGAGTSIVGGPDIVYEIGWGGVRRPRGGTAAEWKPHDLSGTAMRSCTGSPANARWANSRQARMSAASTAGYSRRTVSPYRPGPASTERVPRRSACRRRPACRRTHRHARRCGRAGRLLQARSPLRFSNRRRQAPPPWKSGWRRSGRSRCPGRLPGSDRTASRARTRRSGS